MRIILFFFCIVLFAAQGLAQSRRRYVPRDTFVHFVSEKCFEITREEGERAFRWGDWETAASLFRAAKNCADADQNKRRDMSRRIADSRQAAIDELVEKEQKALRLARQAIATNRANDARILLKNGQRSLAYRLADFAGRYIAPPGELNTDCQQAVLDAWDYLPYYHSWMRDQPNLGVPFCFQLADNLGENTQVRYQKRGSQSRLYTFSPREHLLRSWDKDLSEAATPIRMDTTLTGFEVSPDGRTLLFWSDRRFVLWRGMGDYFTIEAPNRSLFAFSEGGDLFYYLDPQKELIREVAVQSDFRAGKVQKRGKGYNYGDATKEPSGLPVDPANLLAMAVQGNAIWLAYTDRVLVVSEKTIHTFKMPYMLYSDTRPGQVQIWPGERQMTYLNDTLVVLFRLPKANSPDGSAIEQIMAFRERPLICLPKLLMTCELTKDESEGRIFFKENGTDITYFSYSPLPYLDTFALAGGTVSPDQGRYAVVSKNGVLEVFSLKKIQNGDAEPFFTTQNYPLTFSPDGQTFVALSDSLRVFRTDQWRQMLTARQTDSVAAVLAVGNHWVAHRTSPDSIELFHFDTRRHRSFEFASQDNRYIPNTVTLSSDEQWFAYAAMGNEVVAVPLGDHKSLVRHTFESFVTGLVFVPNSTKLLVTVSNAGFYTSDQNIRLWDLSQPEKEPEPLLLPDFIVEGNPVFSPDGRWVALSNATGSRVFDLNNLTEEHSFIRHQNILNASVSAVSFSPDGQLLVLGYSDGHSIAWDIQSRQVHYRLSPPSSRPMRVAGFSFSADGLQMRQVLQPSFKCTNVDIVTRCDGMNTFLSRTLDMDSIHRVLSEGARQLTSFTADQILDYDLESTLSYGDNFQRLAGSGDLPLIRSFFDFYQQQAAQSNNSQQVRQFCDRAYLLFQKLDPASQRSLQRTTLGMYEDLVWKLLLRGKTEEAAKTIRQTNLNFAQPLSMIKWAAHTALLRGGNELRNAANLYADWLMLSAETDGGYDNYEHYQLSKEVRKMNSYGLLNGQKRAFVCQMFGELDQDLDEICAELTAEAIKSIMESSAGVTPDSIPAKPEVELSQHFEEMLQPTTRLRWEIFRGLETLDRTPSFAARQKQVEAYLTDAKKLARQNAAYRPILEQTALKLAQIQIAEGVFEGEKDRAVRLYEQADKTLQSNAPFYKYAADYWNLRSVAQLYLGNIYLNRGNMQGAAQAYEECRQSLQAFEKTEQADPGRWGEAISSRIGALFTQFGMLCLFEGRAADAELSFEKANDIAPRDKIGLYIGHAKILAGDRFGALINYGGGIASSADNLGLALADLERIAEWQPAHRDSLLKFAVELRKAALSAKSDLDSVVVQYYYTRYKTQHFDALRQWDAARRWSVEKLRCTNKLCPPNDLESSWQEDWFDARLSAAYYHLFGGSRDTAALSAAILYSLEAERRLEAGAIYSSAYLLKTNLAHALLLRNLAGDREEAIRNYTDFLALNSAVANDLWSVLEKDFRDLHEAGVVWPGLRQVIRQINPDVKMSPEAWRAMGAEVN